MWCYMSKDWASWLSGGGGGRGLHVPRVISLIACIRKLEVPVYTECLWSTQPTSHTHMHLSGQSGAAPVLGGHLIINGHSYLPHLGFCGWGPVPEVSNGSINVFYPCEG